MRAAVEEFCDILAPGGRLCIITFHSLEEQNRKGNIQQKGESLHMPQGIPHLCLRQKSRYKEDHRQAFRA